MGGARHNDPAVSWSRARAERGGGDERNEAFGGGARAADAANPLRATVRYYGLNGVVPAKIAVWLRVRLAKLDQETSCWSSIA